MEMSERQIKLIEGAALRLSVNDDDRQPVAAIRRAVGRGRGRRQPMTPRQPSSSATCRYCGGQFPTQVAAPLVPHMERRATTAERPVTMPGCVEINLQPPSRHVVKPCQHDRRPINSSTNQLNHDGVNTDLVRDSSIR